MAVVGRSGSFPRPRYHSCIRILSIAVLVTVFVTLDFLELGKTATQHRSLPSTTDKDFLYSGDAKVVRNDENPYALQNSIASTSMENTAEAIAKAADTKGSGHEVQGDSHQQDFQVLGLSTFPWKQEVGIWLQKCGSASEPIEVVEEIHSRGCPKNCFRAGVCNREVGECRCRSGYNGTDCHGFDEHPCNLEPFVPDAVVRWVVSVCPAFCDDRTAHCVCGPGSEHPDRPLQSPCGITPAEGGVVYTAKNREFLYGTDPSHVGWCNADPDKVKANEQTVAGTCPCSIDGREGPFCELYARAYCVGGCNNHGDCLAGYCQCEDGWYGIDCSIPSTKTRTPYKHVPPWLRLDKNVEADSSNEASRKLLETEGPKETRGRRLREVRVVQRRRPLIYVYDLPGEFTFHHYEGRQIRTSCVPWMYNARNETKFEQQLYGMEAVVLESLLASPHRTTNGNEADFFYVPLLTACIIARADESPRLDMRTKFNSKRPFLMANYVIKTYEYIRRKFPFWKRSDGRDHIWMFPWDEGACYAPQLIWNSTMLTTWGNTMANHNASTTAYLQDNWDFIPKHIRGTHPCFDQSKDIVMPAWKAPRDDWLRGKMWARPFEDRDKLFYFSGQLGPDYPNGRPQEMYSMGIRQKVAKYFGSIPNNNNELGSLHEDGVVVTTRGSASYSHELSTSRFCGVFPGDGFSARLEDSILHGCIPVIIQDGIQMAFENVFDFSAFAIRIAEAEIPKMLATLKAVSEAEVRSKLAAIQRLWQRWTYSSIFKLEAERQLEWYGHRHFWGEQYGEMVEDDAIATLFQVLHFKLHNDEWRKGEVGRRLSARKKSGLSAVCNS